MAKKKEIGEDIKELKNKLQEGKAIIGTESVIKKLKTDKLNKIYMTNNCSPKIKEDIDYYAKLANVTIISLNMDNEELGVLCKKNYFISVIGIIE
jgi:ribosomal protein L30E